ncbi:hypothetical protein GBA52_023146 [Prunus armeniaca]|nr:hypothetical protein GBA52_023146 [Prunus armeniaca]
MNHLVKNSLARLASAINRSHFRPSVAYYYRFCSHFSGNNFEPESWKSMEGLVRCPANHVPLSPIVFLERAARAYTDRTSLVYGCLKYTWAQTHERCLKLASALTQLGISLVMWLNACLSMDCAYVSLQWVVPHLGVAAQGGTNICLRKVNPKYIFDNIVQYNVTHMGGAPTVLNMIVNSLVSDQRPLPRKVEIMTGGSPPPQILFKMEELGFGVNHLYGLTETYGPGTYCSWKPEWDSLPSIERSKLKARQGVQHLGLEEVDIKILSLWKV